MTAIAFKWVQERCFHLFLKVIRSVMGTRGGRRQINTGYSLVLQNCSKEVPCENSRTGHGHSGHGKMA